MCVYRYIYGSEVCVYRYIYGATVCVYRYMYCAAVCVYRYIYGSAVCVYRYIYIAMCVYRYIYSLARDVASLSAEICAVHWTWISPFIILSLSSAAQCAEMIAFCADFHQRDDSMSSVRIIYNSPCSRAEPVQQPGVGAAGRDDGLHPARDHQHLGQLLRDAAAGA